MIQVNGIVQLDDSEVAEEHAKDCVCCPPPGEPWDELSFGNFE